MKALRAGFSAALACLAILVALLATPPAAAQTTTLLNFDSAATGDPRPYLTGFGVTVTGVSGGSDVSIQAAPFWVTIASSPNAMVGPGGAGATSYTLNLPSAVTSITFVRGGPSSPTSVAGWNATALNSSGGTVTSVGEGQFCCTEPAKTFTLTGAGITALRITSNGCSCGIQSPWIDNLTFSPALTTATATPTPTRTSTPTSTPTTSRPSSSSRRG